MDESLDLVKKYLEKHFDNPPVILTPDSTLKEVGIDSLGMLELVFEIEDAYGIRLPENLPMPETIGELLRIVEQYKSPIVHE
ncbi:MAG: acyl carrier protein [Ferrovum sp.]|nr:acyl carrier protein [Ferrovum sp.]